MENFIPEFKNNLDLSSFSELILFQHPVDFRSGVNGLVSWITAAGLNAASGALYLFTNKSRHGLKGVYYDGNNFWLLQKRPVGSHYVWPVSDHTDDYIRITEQQYAALLSGFRISPNEYFRSFTPKYC